MNDMRILVTGGAGFIGSELVRQLVGYGTNIAIVDNLANGKFENIKDAIGDKCRFEQVDIRNQEKMKDLLESQEVVIHMACLGVRHSIHSPEENHDVNATATLNLLRLARDAGVKRFLYCSSSEVYGTAQSVPMSEDHPTFPMTVYGASKLAGECYARAYHRTYGYPVTIVRPFNSYGPRCHHEGDSGEVIPKFILRAQSGKPMMIFGDGTQTRDFTYVSDTAAGIIKAAMSDKAIGKTLNLGSCNEITINELAETIKKILDINDAAIEYTDSRPGDVLRLYADSTQAAEIIGFKPEITLRTGLEKLVQWYHNSDRSNKELLNEEITQNWIV